MKTYSKRARYVTSPPAYSGNPKTKVLPSLRNGLGVDYFRILNTIRRSPFRCINRKINVNPTRYDLCVRSVLKSNENFQICWLGKSDRQTIFFFHHVGIRAFEI